MFPGIFTFIRVGRSKVSYTKEIENKEAFFAAIKPHLFSEDLSYSYDKEKNQGLIFAGFYKVGEFEIKTGGQDAAR